MKVELIKSDSMEIEIHVEGRIDSTNAELFYDKVLSYIENIHDQKVTLNIDELGYISSAGLRSVLKIQKQLGDNFVIINASPDVMEIFEETGFSSIIKIKRAYKKISVEGCRIVGKGANGIVYRLDEDKIVKVYSPTASIEEIQREQDLAQKAFFKGIPTAIAYNIVKVNESFGVVFELIDAECLSSAIVNDPDMYDKLSDNYADVYKLIHSIEADAKEFPSIKELYYEYIEECSGWYSADELSKLRQLVESIPDRKTLIHGDYHPRNIMIQNSELIMIDMGDMSIGHPVFDFLATAATQANLVELNPEYAQIHTGMPIENIKRLWNDLLKKYFNDKTEDEIIKIDRQIRLFSKLKVALAPAVAKNLNKGVLEASVADGKSNLLPIIDELIGSINW